MRAHMPKTMNLALLYIIYGLHGCVMAGFSINHMIVSRIYGTRGSFQGGVVWTTKRS